MIKTAPLFFEDKPLFGLDIGHGALRVLELDKRYTVPRIVGYGAATFDPTAIQDGVIIKPKVVAEAALELFKHHLIGDITTNRVAVALPVARAFTRSLQIPLLSRAETIEAVRTEAEQYIPAPLESLYIDYTRTNEDSSNELFMVALPKAIVDSYLVLTELLGLEAVLLETSIGACAQLFAKDKQSDIPSVLIDFGSDSADITVYDKGIMVSGTVACGGDHITKLLEQALHVSTHEAVIIKSKYGLGYSKKQKHIQDALALILGLLIKEIKRTVRYYEELSGGKQSIGQVVTMGGGANMIGLTDYLTESLRLPVRAFDPTSYINSGHLQPFSNDRRMSYVTVTGLSMVTPPEVFE